MSVESHRAYMREYMRKRLKNETPEQRQERLARMRARNKRDYSNKKLMLNFLKQQMEKDPNLLFEFETLRCCDQRTVEKFVEDAFCNGEFPDYFLEEDENASKLG